MGLCTIIRDPFLEKIQNNSPLVMGILNATPDSFYAASALDGRAALDRVLEFEAEGADIVDIGAESTRPGSEYLSESEELKRLIPVIELIRAHSNIALSLDTRKAGVAREALKYGVVCINDVSAFEDSALADLVAESACYCVLMHKKGTPRNMQDAPRYGDVVSEVANYLLERVAFARARGVAAKRIIVDPGLGFGKTYADNVRILQNIHEFLKLGYPVLIGHSRKSFIAWILSEKARAAQTRLEDSKISSDFMGPEERMFGSLAVLADMYTRGVRMFRVHDVRATREVLRTLEFLARTQC